MNLRRLQAPWKRRRPRFLGGAALVVALALVPLLIRSPYALSTLVLIGIYTTVTIGLCLLMGVAGQISLGQAAFYGLGAYGSAILTTRYGWSPWLAMVGAAVMAGLVAHLIGTPIFRLRGHYLAMGTLAFGAVAHIVMVEWREVTGGPTGLPGIPRLTLGSMVLRDERTYYYLVWAVALVGLVVALNIVGSRVGRALRAIRDSEPAAESLGIEVARFKSLILVTSAVYASVAGSLYAHYTTFVNPAAFDFDVSVRLVLMAAVGGLGSIWGAPLGAAAIMLLSLVLREVAPLLTAQPAGEYEMIAYGALLVVIMLFLPQGLAGMRMPRNLPRIPRING
ncbi:MAG: branched-chain amino acid ABC transporter permease [Chloroflexi bacterium]|nr:branched-chain amino acid ABC transporter permease [Chloroflexota bacterium]